ncbi:MAG: ATP-binding protein [Acetobacteraceae bacterium]|nr:ATP-binding protein [Acetobacteraceae bacterium]
MLAAFGLRQASTPWLPDEHPFLLFFVAILISAALFDHGTGLMATVLSALLAAGWLMPALARLRVDDPRDLYAIGLFVAIGAGMSFVIESLHRSLAGQRAANAELRQSERKRVLLLQEFRHRTRNDLGSLVGLLHLRARAAGSEQLREGLREAAQHAMALARVHTRLSAADMDEGAVIDTRVFLEGLCADLTASITGEGLRPVVLTAAVERHALDSERAVQLGLVLNEAVTNALKYAFPESRQGRIEVRFHREGDSFVLTVADDGIGLPPDGDLDPAPPSVPPQGAGLGTRMLRALAAQLRGSFARRSGLEGRGTVADLRFPVAQPGNGR